MFACVEFSCVDDCCRYGVEIQEYEYLRLISDHKASLADFVGPNLDENGGMTYRTSLGPRGCAFLLPRRGCRLHGTTYKPTACQLFPRDIEEAESAYSSGYLPCFRDYVRSQMRHERQ